MTENKSIKKYNIFDKITQNKKNLSSPIFSICTIISLIIFASTVFYSFSYITLEVFSILLITGFLTCIFTFLSYRSMK